MTATLTAPRESAAARRPGDPVSVCFVIDRLSRAGTETQLLALIRELDRSRVRPTLALLDGGDPVSRALEPADCPVIRLGVTRLASRAAARAAGRLRDFWDAHETDVVQAYFLDPAYFAVPLARWHRMRGVVRVRNNLGYWLTPKHRLMNRVVGRLAGVTLTNTDAGRDALVRSEGLSADRVAVVPNGVDLDRFAAPPPFPGRPEVVVGCVANLRPVKNVDGLMRAAAAVLARHPHARFQVAGDGEQRSDLEALRDALGLGDRFRLLGSVSDIPGFLRGCDIVASPSHSEGMSNAILEAMAAGRPVVAADVGASAAVVGDAGVVVPPGSADALADALGGLVADPGRGRRLGAAARERVEAQFSRSAMRQRFEQFFAEMAGRPEILDRPAA